MSFARNRRILFNASTAPYIGAGTTSTATSSSGEFQVVQFVPRDLVTDKAIADVRTASRARHDSHRSGYVSVTEFADWIVTDLKAAIDTEFPAAEVCVCMGYWHLQRYVSPDHMLHFVLKLEERK